MIIKRKVLASAIAAMVLGATAASAAPVTFTGGTTQSSLSGFNPSGSDAALSGPFSTLHNASMGLVGKSEVTFTYVGTEAGYKNSFWASGSKLFDNKTSASGDSHSLVMDGGALDFAFKTERPSTTAVNGATSGAYGSIAFFQKDEDSIYALFNDASRSDQDFDDMVVRIDVKPVPLPAAAVLLLSGMGVLGAVSARRNRKEA